MKRTARRLVLAAGLGAVVFAGVALYGDVSELGDRLSSFSWWSFAAALGLAAINYAVRFGRWSLYLRDRDIELPGRTSALVFVSGLALAVTPGKVGELVKSYLLRAIRGVPIARSAPMVIAERVTDLIGLLLLGLVGVALYGVGGVTIAVGGAVVGFGLTVLAWPALCHAIIDLATWPLRLRPLRPRLRELHANLASLVRPWPLAWASMLGVVAWMAECAGFALVVNGFAGASIPLGLATLIYATTTIAGAFSFLPGGLLVTEAGMRVALDLAGVDPATSSAATILTRLATLWFAVLLGVAALAALRRHAPEAAAALDGEPPAAAAPRGGEG